ncbi:MAG: 50S ribosomal protein L1 [Candidatus Methanomethylicota archaeon]|jgi:large subunit ribosomal protein L1|uniref:Large ribosomal subunit protein uL1 n=1 Tax=Thermoproteota archaeon TaxID=2056631 RepID=A0A523BGX6_9CREN|nr:MAG: 50S ribosomal protein L1 [Candidatus Verstraetearchaeota archaeon]TDA40183.1 MAG: 50S ribosomal protein L1 [Candidatus Verstraetearchaeota archaeon]
MLDINSIISLVDEAKKNSKKRNFLQSIELIVNLKGIDVKAPENRINEIVTLPNPIGKDIKICVIADGDLVTKAKQSGADLVITKQELEGYAGDKKLIKKLAESYDFFIARADLMAMIGKIFGSVLGPRGKMPDPVAPTANIENIIKNYRNAVRIRIRDQPVIKCRVGLENMDSKTIAENIMAVLNAIDRRIKLDQFLSSIIVKTTMGKPAKLKVM